MYCKTPPQVENGKNVHSTQTNFTAREIKGRKIREADISNTAWRKLSYKEQLVELDKRPGRCAKQRAKIKERMEKRDENIN
jgi:hypothetical protein